MRDAVRASTSRPAPPSGQGEWCRLAGRRSVSSHKLSHVTCAPTSKFLSGPASSCPDALQNHAFICPQGLLRVAPLDCHSVLSTWKKKFQNEWPLQPHLQIAASPLFFLIKRGWRRADFTLPLCPFQIDSDIALSCPLVPSLILSSATCPVEQPCQCSSATSLWCSWSASRVKLDLSPKIPNCISYIRQLFAI